WHVSAPPQTRRVRWYGHRTGDLQENCRTSRRQNFSRIPSWTRLNLSFRFGPYGEQCMKFIGGDGMPIQVLLVEDSPGDVRLTQEAFREANSAIHLHVTTDGVEAMAFLNRQGIHARAPRPDLILLDLNLPKMDGREVLANIKEDPVLKTIPTVILTTSDAEADIVKSYQLQANCYLSKPVQLDAFESLVGSINDFWLTKVKLPRQR